MKRELFSLAVEGIKGKKRSSILLMLVLILSFAFAVVTLSVTGSMNKTNEEYRYDTYGTWYGAIPKGEKQDAEYLEKNECVDEIGISRSYGTVVQGTTGIGTVDDTLKKIGRIDLQDGHFPEKADEIAMEADVLSMLGYSYELGQKIVVDVSVPAMIPVVDQNAETEETKTKEEGGTQSAVNGTIQVKQTYTLCGVIREYSDLWFLEDSSQVLNGAVITEEGVENLEKEAQKAAEEIGGSLIKPDFQYFFTAAKGREDELKGTLNQWILSERDKGKERKTSVNAYAFQDAEQVVYHYFYLGMILVTTLLAVVCIYTVQLQKQVRQIALFRSIGITKWQLGRMLFYETLCISVPAAVLGTILGVLGTWTALRVLMNFGEAAVHVEIPFAMLAVTILLWILGIFAARLLVFQIALRQPLTGRISMGQKRAKRYRRVRNVMVIILASMFCGSLLFCVLQSLLEIEDAGTWSRQASYSLMTESGFITVSLDGSKPKMITEQKVAQLKAVPGIQDMDAYVNLSGELKFEGMETCEYSAQFLEPETWSKLSVKYFLPSLETVATSEGDKEIPFPEGIGVDIRGIREEKWSDYFDIEEVGIDVDAFREGKQVIVCLPADLDGNVVFDSKKYQDFGLEKGDMLELGFYGQKIINGEFGSTEKIGNCFVDVGGFLFTEGEKSAKSVFWKENPYTILCSDKLAEKIMEEMKPGYVCGWCVTGNEFGYTNADIYTSMTAGYLSTDYLVADISAENGFRMFNNRELYAAYIQQDVQNLILILSSSGSICLILILIIWNTLRLEAEEEKRSFGILQAIGMSAWQMHKKILKKSVAVAAGSVLMGWSVYGGYFLASGLKEQRRLAQEFGEIRSLKSILEMNIYGRRLAGTNLMLIIGITLAAAAAIILIYHISKRCLFEKDVLAKLREER